MRYTHNSDRGMRSQRQHAELHTLLACNLLVVGYLGVQVEAEVEEAAGLAVD
ncbi:MAG: hypothetical protein AMXMBFR16_13260 [Candidatus Uhrbacteria bacterium]